MSDLQKPRHISTLPIIMAGSGMATGGRVRHHLKHNISREECCVIFVGFAAKGTLARQIIDGQNPVHILGDDIQGPHHQRVLGPRRSGRAIEMA